MEKPNEDHAAELRAISDSLVDNTEFPMTLLGQRTAPHFEREHIQQQKTNLNDKGHPPRLVGSICERTTFLLQR